MRESIPSNILATGNRFVVTDETNDGTFGPGTTGIMGYIKGVDTDCANIAYSQVVILKRGKQGKRRLDTCIISTPIFDFKNMHESEIMPDNKRKQYVYIKPSPFFVDTVFDIGALEYLGWISAWTNYLHQLSKFTKPFNIWPERGKDVMNKVLSISNYWYEDRDYVEDYYCSFTEQQKFLKRIRIMEATLVGRALEYMTKVAEMEVAAAEYLNKHRSKTKAYTKEVINSTINKACTKYSNLRELRNRNNFAPEKKLIFPGNIFKV